MTRYTMNAARALEIIKEIAAQRRRWGKQMAPPYTMPQLLEAIELLDEAGQFEPAVADTGKLRRQLQAANARETRLRQQLAEHSTESKPSQDGDADHAAAQQ